MGICDPFGSLGQQREFMMKPFWVALCLLLPTVASGLSCSPPWQVEITEEISENSEPSTKQLAERFIKFFGIREKKPGNFMLAGEFWYREGLNDPLPHEEGESRYWEKVAKDADGYPTHHVDRMYSYWDLYHFSGSVISGEGVERVENLSLGLELFYREDAYGYLPPGYPKNGDIALESARGSADMTGLKIFGGNCRFQGPPDAAVLAEIDTILRRE